MALPKFKMPQSRWGQVLFFLTTQFVSYFLFVANTRAFTMGSYMWTWSTDTLLAANAFIMAKLMVDHKEARGFWAGLGYVAGGPIGSIISIYITKRLYGH